jgi:hypothetical protein
VQEPGLVLAEEQQAPVHPTEVQEPGLVLVQAEEQQAPVHPTEVQESGLVQVLEGGEPELEPAEVRA